ncbi:MAG TPA: hypothetical protein VL588_06030 [Bdellovibrionota bacterium]|nr:hypothetical protein [Bdellovibrionota bacterium]
MKNRLPLLALALVVSLSIAGCGSIAKRAGEAMEKGDYGTAVALYEQAVARDPKDTEAQAGLKQARAKYMDQRLLQVRKARLGGNAQEALDLLAETLDQQERWKMPAMGNASFTQEEEMGYAVKSAQGLVAESVKAGQPLRGEWLLRRYEKIFQGKNRAAFDQLQASTQDRGRKDCQGYLKMDLKTHPWFALYALQVCQHWHGPAVAQGKAGDPAAQLFRAVELDTKTAQGVPDETISYAKEKLGDALRRTAWYDPKGGAVLRLSLAGHYTRDDDKVQVDLQHKYTEYETVTQMVDVRKSRVVYRDQTVQEIIPGTHAYRTVVKSQPVTEYYTEQQPQQVKKPIDRIYSYGGWKLARHLNLGLSLATEAEGRAINAQVEDKSDQEDTESTLSKPEIGLKPHRANLADPAPWLRTRMERLASELESKLGRAWSDLYCVGSASGSDRGPEAAGDTVMHCLRQKQPQPPAFADQWFRSETGLSAIDAQSLLAL